MSQGAEQIEGGIPEGPSPDRTWGRGRERNLGERPKTLKAGPTQRIPGTRLQAQHALNIPTCPGACPWARVVSREQGIGFWVLLVIWTQKCPSIAPSWSMEGHWRQGRLGAWCSHLLQEWLDAVQCVLDILVQLRVTGHLHTTPTMAGEVAALMGGPLTPSPAAQGPACLWRKAQLFPRAPH